MKTWKNLAIPVIILLVLIGGLIVYQTFFKDKGKDATETTATSEANIVQYDSANISSIEVDNKDGTGFSLSSHFETVTATPAATATPAVAGQATETQTQIWTYGQKGEDVSKYTFAQSDLVSLVNIFASCEITNTIIKENADLTEYGLDNPASTITYTLANGETHKLTLGNATPSGDNVYCMLDNNGEVYTTYLIKLTKCSNQVLDVLDKQITSITDTDVASVRFVRAEDQVDVTVNGTTVPTADGSSTQFGWEFTKPFPAEASGEFGNLMDAIFALSVTSYAELNPSDFAKYGLDVPEYEFDITMNSGKQEKIILSKDMGGIYYGYATSSPAIFTLSTQSITGLQTPLLTMIEPYLAYEFISDVKKIDATFPEGSFSMEMAVPENKKILDDESTVTVNGQSAKVKNSDDRSYFALLYESTVCINITGFDLTAQPVDTKDITITIYLNDNTSTIIDLAKKDENTYYAFINGSYYGFLVNRDELYKDNGTNLYDYGTWAAYERMTEALNGQVNGVYDVSGS